MPSPTRVVKQRRFHRKSKRGCAECKRRHIKCDEARPQCANCRISHRDCVYIDPSPEPSVAAASPAAASLATSPSSTQGYSPQLSVAQTPGHDAALDLPVRTTDVSTAPTLPTSSSAWFALPLTPSPSQQDWTPPAPTPSAMPPPPNDDCYNYTFADFALFDHFKSRSSEWLMVSNAFEIMMEVQITFALTTPYIMDQILSVSASHLAATCGSPDEADAYRTRSAQLQNRALRSFNKSLFRRQQERQEQELLEQERLRQQQPQTGSADQPDSNTSPEGLTDSVVAHFLFASLVGRSILRERLASDRHDFNLFLAGLVESMGLLRGSRLVIGSSWQALLDAPRIGEFLNKFVNHKCRGAIPSETHSGLIAIQNMLDQSRLSLDEIEECHKAREGLAYIIDRLEDWGASIMSSWPSMAPPEFMVLVQRRVPESLVILAHYAALMYPYRDWWVFGDAGEYMLRNIAIHLDDEWKKWLPLIPQEGEDAVMT